MPEITPWERRTDETDRAYAAFCVYRDLGPNRTVRDAYRQATGHPGATQASGNYSAWSKRFEWSRRASAWDDRIQQQRQATIEATVRRDAVVWAEGRDKAARGALENGELLLTAARTLARFPVADRKEVKGDDGTTLTVIEPLGQKLLLAAKVSALAYQMMRDAIDHAGTVAEAEVDYRDDPEFADFDPATCDDAEKLERFIERYGRGGR